MSMLGKTSNRNERCKKELFNGYVIEPVPIVVISSILLITSLWLAICATLESLDIPSSVRSIDRNVTISSFHEDYPSIVLQTDHGIFRIPQKAIADISVLDAIVAEQRPINITSSLKQGQKLKNRHVVLLTEGDGGRIIIDENTLTKAWEERGRIALFFCWGLCIFCWAFLIGGYYIVSHADRYPRLAAFFIRKPYRNF